MLPWKGLTVAAAAVFFVLLLLHWGDAYGPNAQRNAKTIAELEAKNSVLEQQLKDDASTYANEQEAREKGLSAFKEKLPTLSACQFAPADVEALLKLIRG